MAIYASEGKQPIYRGYLYKTTTLLEKSAPALHHDRTITALWYISANKYT